MNNDFHSGSRSGYRAKRKKTNLVLNSLIVIVLALIVFVAYSIFASDDKTSSDNEVPKASEKQVAHKDDKEAKGNKESTKEDDANESTTEEETKEASAPEKADESKAEVIEGGRSANVLKTVENPSWRPVGTSQTGEHHPVYDTESVDWQEMLKAMSYASGIEQSNMNIYWLGSDKSTTNASIGTVYSNDNQQKYKVYIKWVDGEGWMPTKVEELIELEK